MVETSARMKHFEHLLLKLSHSSQPWTLLSLCPCSLQKEKNNNNMALVHCGSLASVRSHNPTSPCRVSASLPYVTALLFFWLKSASTSLRACCQLFVCPCRSDHVVVDWGCGKLLIGYALQPTRVPSHPVPVIQTRENAPQPELGICGGGPCICGEQALLKVSGQRQPEKALASFSILPWGSLSEWLRA